MNLKAVFSVGLAALFLLSGKVTMAATQDHKVVIEVVSSDPKQWSKLVSNVENLREALGEKTSVEIVAHGEGLKLLMKANTPLTERMKKAAADGVKFAACENTMKKLKVTKSQLLDYSVTVDSGVAEIIRRQEDHWSYIRN